MNNFKKMIALSLAAIFMFSYAGIASAATTMTTALPNPDELTLAQATTTNATAKKADTQIVNVNNTSTNASIIRYENLPKVKNVSSNLVNVTANNIVIPKGDVFKVSFAQNFTTKNLKVGDKIIFNLKSGLYTQEGTMLLPCGTQIVANVQSYTPPKSFNRNARVMLDFNEILVPNEVSCPMGACVYGKYNALQPSGWATFAKPAIWTAGMFGVGAGLGAAIGAAAGAAGLGCLAIGMPVGGGAGLIIGLVTPGLHYKAKAGKEIPIILTQDMVLVSK